jgi:hypothetical protein
VDYSELLHLVRPTLRGLLPLRIGRVRTSASCARQVPTHRRRSGRLTPHPTALSAVRQHGSVSHHRSGGLAVASGGGAMDGGAVASVPPPKPPF